LHNKQDPVRKIQEDILNTKDARVINLLEEQYHPTQRDLAKETSSFEVPQNYNQTRLIALVRDPQWIYTYWEITQDSLEAHRCQGDIELWDQGHWVLRVFDHTKIDHWDVNIDPHSSNWYLHVGEAGHRFQLCIGRLFPNKQFQPLVWSNQVETPPQGESNVIDEEWLAVEDLLYFSHSNPAPGTSPGLMQAVSLEREAGSGAILNISSPLGHEKKQPPFWLNLQADLIIYGATDPQAQLSIQGEEVPLRNDGTFTCRYTLNNGTIVLPVQARSCDGEVITITPVFTRETY
jgi:hypothetical protein